MILQHVMVNPFHRCELSDIRSLSHNPQSVHSARLTPSMPLVPFLLDLAAFSPPTHHIPSLHPSRNRTPLPDASNVPYMPRLAWRHLFRRIAQITAVKRRALSPSYSFPYLRFGPCYIPALQRQKFQILAYADGLRLSNTATRARCPSLKFKIYGSTTLHQHVGMLSAGCFGFGFCTTATVDVDVEQVSELMLRSRLNTPSPSPATIQLSHKSAPQGQSLRTIHHKYVQDGVYLPFPPYHLTTGRTPWI